MRGFLDMMHYTFSTDHVSHDSMFNMQAYEQCMARKVLVTGFSTPNHQWQTITQGQTDSHLSKPEAHLPLHIRCHAPSVKTIFLTNTSSQHIRNEHATAASIVLVKLLTLGHVTGHPEIMNSFQRHLRNSDHPRISR